MGGRNHCNREKKFNDDIFPCSILLQPRVFQWPNRVLENAFFHVCMQTDVRTWWGYFTCLPGRGLHDDGQFTEYHDHCNIKQPRMLHLGLVFSQPVSPSLRSMRNPETWTIDRDTTLKVPLKYWVGKDILVGKRIFWKCSRVVCRQLWYHIFVLLSLY